MKKGKILGFDPSNGGFIRAADERRYTLPAHAWKGSRPPRAGEDVDFEVDGDVARDVYPLAGETPQYDFSGTVGKVSELLNTSHPFAQKILEHTKKISASMFALILICFFLPFATVSCNGQPYVQVSALELTTGKTFEVPRRDFSGKTESQNIPGDGKAALVLVAAAVGIGTSLLKFRRSSLISAGVGAFGLLMLLAIKSGIDTQLLDKSREAVAADFKANYGLGFWGSTLLFLSAIALNIWQFFNKKIDRGTTP
jgi:hypothetical protein